MSDFDFDELDKAVTGALGNDDAGTPSQNDENSVQSEPRSTPEGAREQAPVRSTTMPAARRGSGGRFMDMVHPSSDMRSKGTTPVSTSPSPVSDPARLPEPPNLYPKAAPVQSLTTPEEPALALEAEDTPAIETPDEPGTDWSKPLESPFLPDAKVEKRPLGGEPATATSLSEELFAFEELHEQLLEAPEEELKLEAPDEPLLEATTMPDPIDFSTEKSEPDTQPVEEPVVKPEAPAEKEEPVGPTSITQQYKEQPAAEQASGAIYDTEAYHQPLAHPVKKRSGVWVVVWIFLLVLLGAGAGAAFYLYVLPML